MEMKEIGFVSNYFGKISVAAIEITDGTIAVGDKLQFMGSTTDCESTVESMQIDHNEVTEAEKGSSVGIRVSEKIRKGDRVYKVTSE